VKPWDGSRKGSSRREEDKKGWQDRERSKAAEKSKKEGE
jgi:hypothetical protein